MNTVNTRKKFFPNVTDEEWNKVFGNVPKYDKNGDPIPYTVEEQEVNPGDLKFYEKQVNGDYQSGFNITNTFRIPDDKVKVEITKKWEDSSNVSNKRPASVKVELSDGANVVRTQELSGTGNEWKHIFTDLPKYEGGKEITYAVVEGDVPVGYESKVEGYNIINSYKPEIPGEGPKSNPKIPRKNLKPDSKPSSESSKSKIKEEPKTSNAEVKQKYKKVIPNTGERTNSNTLLGSLFTLLGIGLLIKHRKKM